jgi:hypothetical protein
MNPRSKGLPSFRNGRDCLRDSLRDWFAEGIRGGHKVMLVCMDTFDAMRDDDFGIYRQYFDSLKEAKAAAKHLAVDGWDCRDHLMEVFDLEEDFQAQVDEGPEKGLARFRSQVT